MKPKAVGIDRDAWLAALEDVGVARRPTTDPTALTVREFCELVGIGETAAKGYLRKLMEGGKATRTHKMVVDTTGRFQCVPAYILHTDTPAKAKSKR